MAGSLFQNSYYVANIINAILYGVVLVLYYMILRQIFAISKRTSTDTFLTCFCTALVLLNTVYWTTQVYFGQMMWIVHADYPGGSDAYWDRYSSVWYQTWGIAACVLSNLMSDALLTYRCFVIWNSRRVIALPAVIWVASLLFSVGVLYGSGKPNGDYFAGIATIFVTAYTASTIAFNVVVTALICGRIIHIGRRMRASYPDPADAAVYTGAAAIVVESALPFTVFSVVYLVTYAMGSDVANAFSFYAMFTCISPLMIILRVLSRRAWTRESGTLFTTTISYRGQADYLTTDAGAGTPVELVEKTSTGPADAKPPDISYIPADSTAGVADVGRLPV
ncbi:hypothetical protein L226DRAFT_531106 [Lentinus tigrinus ALCF2SS1-7]|nr:hypothetical protein L226DRAFT_531106 [Lentinus tigrinus ALCF2SS1-7]